MSAYPASFGNVDWRVSRTCEGGACVGVARQGKFVFVRNTSDPESPASRFTVQEWSEFLAGAKNGDFDDLA